MALGDVAVFRLKSTGQDLWLCALQVLPHKGDVIHYIPKDGPGVDYVIDNIQHYIMFESGPIAQGKVVIEIKKVV